MLISSKFFWLNCMNAHLKDIQMDSLVCPAHLESASNKLLHVNITSVCMLLCTICEAKIFICKSAGCRC